MVSLSAGGLVFIAFAAIFFVGLCWMIPAFKTRYIAVSLNHEGVKGKRFYIKTNNAELTAASFLADANDPSKMKYVLQSNDLILSFTTDKIKNVSAKEASLEEIGIKDTVYSLRSRQHVQIPRSYDDRPRGTCQKPQKEAWYNASYYSSPD